MSRATGREHRDLAPGLCGKRVWPSGHMLAWFSRNPAGAAVALHPYGVLGREGSKEGVGASIQELGAHAQGPPRGQQKALLLPPPPAAALPAWLQPTLVSVSRSSQGRGTEVQRSPCYEGDEGSGQGASSSPRSQPGLALPGRPFVSFQREVPRAQAQPSRQGGLRQKEPQRARCPLQGAAMGRVSASPRERLSPPALLYSHFKGRA